MQLPFTVVAISRQRLTSFRQRLWRSGAGGGGVAQGGELWRFAEVMVSAGRSHSRRRRTLAASDRCSQNEKPCNPEEPFVTAESRRPIPSTPSAAISPNFSLLAAWTFVEVCTVSSYCSTSNAGYCKYRRERQQNFVLVRYNLLLYQCSFYADVAQFFCYNLCLPKLTIYVRLSDADCNIVFDLVIGLLTNFRGTFWTDN